MMRFFAEGVVLKHTAQQKGLNTKTGRIYKSACSKASRKVLMAMLSPFKPDVIETGALSLHITVVWPYRVEDLATIAKRERADCGQRIPCSVKPDADNIGKEIQDVLEKLEFFEGTDSSVYDFHCTKFFGARPGIEIEIRSFGE